MVGVRVIALGATDHERSDQVVAAIVEATNFQNTINKADLRSNDIRQIELERELAARGYRYQRKRGKSDAVAPLSYLKREIKKEDIATAVGGALYESLPLRLGQSPLFDPDLPYYREIFEKDVDFLLVCYWLWKTVNQVAGAKHQPQEAKKAKYLVHYEAFRDLRPFLMHRPRSFITAAERRNRVVMRPLQRALNVLFVVGRDAYRANKVVDRVALTPDTYHKRRDIYENFLEQWHANPKRQDRYYREMDEFKTALRTVRA